MKSSENKVFSRIQRLLALRLPASMLPLLSVLAIFILEGWPLVVVRAAFLRDGDGSGGGTTGNFNANASTGGRVAARVGSRSGSPTARTTPDAIARSGSVTGSSSRGIMSSVALAAGAAAAVEAHVGSGGYNCESGGLCAPAARSRSRLASVAIIPPPSSGGGMSASSETATTPSGPSSGLRLQQPLLHHSDSNPISTQEQDETEGTEKDNNSASMETSEDAVATEQEEVDTLIEVLAHVQQNITGTGTAAVTTKSAGICYGAEEERGTFARAGAPPQWLGALPTPLVSLDEQFWDLLGIAAGDAQATRRKMRLGETGASLLAGGATTGGDSPAGTSGSRPGSRTGQRKLSGSCGTSGGAGGCSSVGGGNKSPSSTAGVPKSLQEMQRKSIMLQQTQAALDRARYGSGGGCSSASSSNAAPRARPATTLAPKTSDSVAEEQNQYQSGDSPTKATCTTASDLEAQQQQHYLKLARQIELSSDQPPRDLFTGTWVLEKHTNYRGLIKKLGRDPELRKSMPPGADTSGVFQGSVPERLHIKNFVDPATGHLVMKRTSVIDSWMPGNTRGKQAPKEEQPRLPAKNTSMARRTQMEMRINDFSTLHDVELPVGTGKGIAFYRRIREKEGFLAGGLPLPGVGSGSCTRSDSSCRRSFGGGSSCGSSSVPASSVPTMDLLPPWPDSTGGGGGPQHVIHSPVLCGTSVASSSSTCAFPGATTSSGATTLNQLPLAPTLIPMQPLPSHYYQTQQQLHQQQEQLQPQPQPPSSSPTSTNFYWSGVQLHQPPPTLGTTTKMKNSTTLSSTLLSSTSSSGGIPTCGSLVLSGETTSALRLTERLSSASGVLTAMVWLRGKIAVVSMMLLEGSRSRGVGHEDDVVEDVDDELVTQIAIWDGDAYGLEMTKIFRRLRDDEP